MKLIDRINQLTSRFNWSLLGFVLAAIIGAVSIYTEFYRDTRARLEFLIVSNASVLDVREDIGDLEILYDGKDIRKARQALSVIVVRIANTGGEDILKTYYDDLAPLGLDITSGTLLRAELLSATDPYLSDNLTVRTTGGTGARFSPVIFGSGQEFSVKLLLLHADTVSPTIRPVGRVARVSQITLVSGDDSGQESFLNQVYSGSLWVQLVRLPTYTLGAIAFVVLLVLAIVAPGAVISKRRRRKTVRRYKATLERDSRVHDELLFQKYIDHGAPYLRSLEALISSDTDLTKRMQTLDEDRASSLRVEEHMVMKDRRTFHIVNQFELQAVYDISEAGFIKKEGDTYTVDPGIRSCLKEFLKFLTTRGE